MVSLSEYKRGLLGLSRGRRSTEWHSINKCDIYKCFPVQRKEEKHLSQDKDDQQHLDLQCIMGRAAQPYILQYKACLQGLEQPTGFQT